MKTTPFPSKFDSSLLRNPVVIITVLVSLAYGISLSVGIPPLWLTVLLGAGLVAVLAFQSPGLAGAALLFVVWSNVSDVLIKFHGIPSVAKPLVALLFVILLARRFSTKPVPIKTDATLWWLLAYLFLMALGIWYAPAPDLVVGPTIDFAKDVVIYLIILNFLSNRQSMITGMWLLLITGTILGSLSLYQELTGTYQDTYGGLARVKLAYIADGVEQRPRSAGPIQDPNFYSQILLIPLAVGFWAAANARRWTGRIIALLAIIACLTGIVLSFSRSGYLAATLMLFLFALHIRLNARFLLIVPVLIALLYVAPSEFLARFGTLQAVLPNQQGVTADSAVRGRTIEMLMGVNVFADYPVLGVGQANFARLYPTYVREYGGDVPDAERNTHSLYLQVAAEHGIIGVAIIIGIMAMTWNRLLLAQRLFKQSGDRSMAELAVVLQIGFAGYVVSAIFLHDAYPIYLWGQVAIASALYLLAKSQLAGDSTETEVQPSSGPVSSATKA